MTIAVKIQIAVMLMSGLVATEIFGQNESPPNFEELQRELNISRAEQERQESLRRQNSAAEQARQRAAAEQEARKGTLVIRSNESCSLTINGAAAANLHSEITASIKLLPGNLLIECHTNDRRRAETERLLGVGEQLIVQLMVPPPSRFRSEGGGVRDEQLGVLWASSDNGSDVSWNSASRYCSNKGPQWRLPSAAELRSLYSSPAVGSPCGRYSCNIPDLIQLTDFMVWSSESENGGAEARAFSLADGRVHALPIDHKDYVRALCVR